MMTQSGSKGAVWLAIVIVLLLALLSFGQLATGSHSNDHGQPGSGAKPEIYCLAKSASQLCTHGTADVLKLEGAKRAKWIEAARRYNTAVDAATKQFLAEAKATLSPDEFAIVEKWFAPDVNAQLNRKLLVTDK